MRPRTSLRVASTIPFILLFAVACGTSTPIPVVTTAPTVVTAPPSALSPNSSTAAPAEVLGSVLLEQGRSAVGGTVDTTIQVEVDLSATSTAGKVTDMRVKPVFGCDNAGQVDGAEWEPFAARKYLSVGVGLNWIGFYVAAQFRDDKGNLSLVYCDDISIEGNAPAVPAVNPSDWYPQIQCFSSADVHPSQGETLTGSNVTFSWPNTNQLPDGVFYQVNAYSAVDQYAGMAAQGRTRDTSITLPIAPEKAGDIVWYVVLTDANGTMLDHGRCGSFAASLLTVDPPTGIKGVHFTYKP